MTTMQEVVEARDRELHQRYAEASSHFETGNPYAERAIELANNDDDRAQVFATLACAFEDFKTRRTRP